MRRFYGFGKNVITAYFGRVRWQNVVVVHDPRFLSLPPQLALWLIAGHVKGKLRCPNNMTIVLVHDYTTLPLAEQSLRYVGIDTYIVLRPQYEGRYVHTLKLKTILDYLLSDACTTDYIFYVDSRDVFFRAAPSNAIHALQAQNCDLLFSTANSFVILVF